MAGKKIKGTVEITLNSKQFVQEAKKVQDMLKGFPQYVKNVDQSLKGMTRAWQPLQKEMNKFASTSSIIQNSNYNNLKTSAVKTTDSLKTMGTTGTKTGEQVKGMSVYLDKASGKAKILNDSVAKTKTGLQNIGPASDTVIARMQKMGIKFESAATQQTKLQSVTTKTTPKITKLGTESAKTSQKITQSGAAAGKAGQQYTTMGNAAGGAGQKMQTLGNTSHDAAGGLKTVEQGSLKTSASITASVQSTVALTQGIQGTVAAYRDMAQVQIDVEAKEVSVEQIRIGLEKATIDAAAEERALAEARRTGSLTTEELADRTNKLAIEYEQIANDQKDLRVNTEELALVKEKVNDAYINFATTIAQTVVGAYGTLASFMTEDTKRTLKNIAAKISGSVANTKLAASSTAVAAGMTAQAAATTAAAKAQWSLTAAARAFILSPPGIALMAMGALWIAWETNALGFRDAVHSVIDTLQKLGGWIVKVFQPALNGITKILNAIGIQTGNLGDAFEDLSQSMSGNIDEWQELEKKTRGTKDDMSLLKWGISETGETLDAYAETMAEAALQTHYTIDETENFAAALGTAEKQVDAFTRKLMDSKKEATDPKFFQDLETESIRIMGVYNEIVQQHGANSKEAKKFMEDMSADWKKAYDTMLRYDMKGELESIHHVMGQMPNAANKAFSAIASESSIAFHGLAENAEAGETAFDGMVEVAETGVEVVGDVAEAFKKVGVEIEDATIKLNEFGKRIYEIEQWDRPSESMAQSKDFISSQIHGNQIIEGTDTLKNTAAYKLGYRSINDFIQDRDLAKNAAGDREALSQITAGITKGTTKFLNTGGVRTVDASRTTYASSDEMLKSLNAFVKFNESLPEEQKKSNWLMEKVEKAITLLNENPFEGVTNVMKKDIETNYLKFKQQGGYDINTLGHWIEKALTPYQEATAKENELLELGLGNIDETLSLLNTQTTAIVRDLADDNLIGTHTGLDFDSSKSNLEKLGRGRKSLDTTYTTLDGQIYDFLNKINIAETNDNWTHRVRGQEFGNLSDGTRGAFTGLQWDEFKGWMNKFSGREFGNELDAAKISAATNDVHGSFNAVATEIENLISELPQELQFEFDRENATFKEIKQAIETLETGGIVSGVNTTDIYSILKGIDPDSVVNAQNNTTEQVEETGEELGETMEEIAAQQQLLTHYQEKYPEALKHVLWDGNKFQDQITGSFYATNQLGLFRAIIDNQRRSSADATEVAEGVLRPILKTMELELNESINAEHYTVESFEDLIQTLKTLEIDYLGGNIYEVIESLIPVIEDSNTDLVTSQDETTNAVLAGNEITRAQWNRANKADDSTGESTIENNPHAHVELLREMTGYSLELLMRHAKTFREGSPEAKANLDTPYLWDNDEFELFKSLARKSAFKNYLTPEQRTQLETPAEPEFSPSPQQPQQQQPEQVQERPAPIYQRIEANQRDTDVLTNISHHLKDLVILAQDAGKQRWGIQDLLRNNIGGIGQGSGNLYNTIRVNK